MHPTARYPRELLVLALWLLAGKAGAGQAVNAISGNLSASENACNRVVAVFSGGDCTYGNDRPGPGAWVGPTANGAYYVPGSAGDSLASPPAPGDGRIAPTLSGTFTIDDAGTAAGADDLLSATLVIGPAARNLSTGNADYAIERWDTLTHVLAPTAVTSAIANGQGGWDYTIGAQGVPALICSVVNPTDCFPSANAPTGIPLPGFWSGPAAVGIERSALLGGNLGATTTASFTNYSCTDNPGDNDCTAGATLWQALEDPGFDNLLIRIATDSAGNIISGSAIWTQEYRINFSETLPGDNSWQAGTLSFSGTVVPISPAAGLFASALALLGAVRRRTGH